MIVYHGTPFGGDRAGVARFLSGRHALIPFPRREDCDVAFAVCQTVVFDNGAFTAWKQGQPIANWSSFYDWCEEWHRHPAFAWAIIPDVIDGDEDANDALLDEWPGHIEGVPVWHLHESFERLERLARWPRLCLGSSGKYAETGTANWCRRMRDAMEVICDEHGRPRTRLHGLRMAAQEHTSRYPFASVDSTNVAQNASLLPRFGSYAAPQRWQRAEAIAWRMEAQQTCDRFDRSVHYAGHEGDVLFAAEPIRTPGFPEGSAGNNAETRENRQRDQAVADGEKTHERATGAT